MKVVNEKRVGKTRVWSKSPRVKMAVGRTGKGIRDTKYGFHRISEPGSVAIYNMKDYGVDDFKEFARKIEANSRSFAKRHGFSFVYSTDPNKGNIYVRRSEDPIVQETRRKRAPKQATEAEQASAE